MPQLYTRTSPLQWSLKKQPDCKLTNEVPMMVEIEQPKEPIKMLQKTEPKYAPGERLIKEAKKAGKKERKERKPEKKRDYKQSISELLEELFT